MLNKTTDINFRWADVNDDIDEMEGTFTVTGYTAEGTWSVSKSKKKSAINPNGKGFKSFLK